MHSWVNSLICFRLKLSLLDLIPKISRIKWIFIGIYISTDSIFLLYLSIRRQVSAPQVTFSMNFISFFFPYFHYSKIYCLNIQLLLFWRVLFFFLYPCHPFLLIRKPLPIRYSRYMVIFFYCSVSMEKYFVFCVNF